MIDREKVIKGLKQHREARLYSCDNCPYTNDTDCQSKLCSDAVALLKEQEPVKPDYSPYYQEWYCGNCGKMIPRAYNYCNYCGKAVKWND